MPRSRAKNPGLVPLSVLLLLVTSTLSGMARAGAEVKDPGTSAAPAASAEGQMRVKDGDCAGAPCTLPHVLTVVYQTGIVIDDAVNTRATAVLKAACQAPDCVLELRDAMRRDVIDSVRSGASQVGLVGLPPAEADRVAESHHLGRLDALLVTPPGYSVVAKLMQAPEKRGWSLSASVFAALLYLAAFLGLLVCSVWALNWQPPTYKGGTATKLDPHLRGASNAIYWIFCRWSGRLVGALWLLTGFGFFVLLRPATSEDVSVRLSSDAPNRGVIDGAYPGRHVSQLRDDAWIICDDLHECFRNLREGRADALAGDRDLLCHVQREAGGLELEFKPDEPFLPVLQAFVFPNTQQGRSIAKLLRDAMNQSAAVSNPWRACSVGHSERAAIGALP